jgi:Tol biopolymer transport system component
MNADGTDLKRLTFNNVWDSRPSWSPASRRILYTSRVGGVGSSTWEIHAIEVNRNNDTVIVANGSRSNRAVWSPNGEHIAFATNLHGNWDIYVADKDGSNRKRLTNDNADDGDVAWSPDSRCLAFVTDRTGDKEIFTMDVEGNQLQNRTENTKDDQYPSWAP